MTNDKDTRFFTDEMIDKAFHPDWPAGTEIVCYCRSTDSRDTIEQIARQRQWKIVEYVHIDELPIAKLYKPGQVMFAKREALEWKRDSTMPTYEEWRHSSTRLKTTWFPGAIFYEDVASIAKIME